MVVETDFAMQKKPAAPPCPSCGAYARTFKDGHSVCAYCGASLPPLPFTHPTGRLANSTPIQEGMRATIGGKIFVVVGQIAYSERDDEDGSISRWDEWVLLAKDSDIRFLEFDSGRWTLSEPIDLDDPFPQNASEGGVAMVDGAGRPVTDAGVMQVAGVSGQIPWPIEVGESAHYVDIGTTGSVYSAEAGPDGVEWYRGRRLEDGEVFTLFGLTSLVSAQAQKELIQGDRRRFGCLTMLMAIACLIGWAVALNQHGAQVANGSTVASAVPEDGQRFGPFHLQPGGKLHRLRLWTGELAQTSVAVQALLEDAQGPLLDTDREFWDESGVDDDGSWHESDLESYQDFVLKAPGDYYVRLMADPEAAATAAPVSFAIETGAIYPLYLAWFGFGGFFFGAFFLMRGVPGSGAKVWEGMASR